MTETERLAIQLEAKHALSVNLIKENKELRTRVVEADEVIAQMAADNVRMSNQMDELKKRVAELTNHEEQTHKDLGEILGTDDSLKNCALRLQNRLSTVEKENDDLKDYGTFAYANGYEQGVFDAKTDLLKASEVMEKALEKLPNEKYHDDECTCCDGAIDHCLERLSASALADFRALKETK